MASVNELTELKENYESELNKKIHNLIYLLTNIDIKDINLNQISYDINRLVNQIDIIENEINNKKIFE